MTPPFGLTYQELETKRAHLFRPDDTSDLGLRLRRAISWLERAERETDDPDAAFIFYWIAFNAAYAADLDAAAQTNEPATERRRFNDYFSRIIALDESRLIYNAVWDRFSGPIRLLLDNQFVFQPFWNYHNRLPGYEQWEMMFENSLSRIHGALARQDTGMILNTLFDRLYVLRNQLIHGGATWNSSRNRDQVRDGARIMAFLTPIFINLMLEHPEIDWGPPYYSVIR